MPTPQWNIQTWTANLASWTAQGEAGHYGDHWGDPEADPALGQVRDDWVTPVVGQGRTVLEIGSGGGRWTQYLLGAARLWCVDINPEMFDYLRQRFGERPNLSYVRTTGTDIAGVPAGSVDLAFSFGTFVHLDPELVDGYLATLRGLMRPGADLVLQYPEKRKPLARQNQGFALNTAPLMEGLVRRHGFEVQRRDLGLLPHSNLLHATLDPQAPTAHPLATAAPYRFLGWPDYADAEGLAAFFGAFGLVLAGRPHCALCLRYDPSVDGPAESLGPVLQAAFARALPDGADLEVLLVDDPIGVHQRDAVGRAVTAVLLPERAFGVREHFLAGVGAPAVTATELDEWLWPRGAAAVGKTT